MFLGVCVMFGNDKVLFYRFVVYYYVFVVMFGVFCVFVFVLLLVFLGYNVWFVAKNVTTNEIFKWEFVCEFVEMMKGECVGGSGDE